MSEAITSDQQGSNVDVQKMEQEEINEPLIPIKQSLHQLIHTDIMGNIGKSASYLESVYEPEVKSFENMLKVNKYTAVVGKIFSILPSLIGIIPEDKLAEMAIAVLVDDKVSEEVSEILAKNLAKSANIFIDKFNEGIQEKKQELIDESQDLVDGVVSSLGSGVASGLTDAVSDIPPVGAVMAASSAVKGLVGAVDQAIDKTEVAQSTFLEILDKTTREFNEKYDDSGIPQLVQLTKDIDKLSKLNPDAIVEAETQKAQEKVNSRVSEATQAVSDKVESTTQSVQSTADKMEQATQSLTPTIPTTPTLTPTTPSLTPKIQEKKQIDTQKKGGKRLKSILKTAKRHHKNNRKTRRVRFV